MIYPDIPHSTRGLVGTPGLFLFSLEPEVIRVKLKYASKERPGQAREGKEAHDARRGRVFCNAKPSFTRDPSFEVLP